MKQIKKFFIFFIFCLAFFIPRYISSGQYNAMEDELLSIDFNQLYSAKQLVLYNPDRAHPPLWYVLMEKPTSILGIDHGISYYRLIQVLILFSLLTISLLFFYKKLPGKFTAIFFTLFLSNNYLVHLTTQHRMYAMVVGIAVLYSIYWYYLIKSGKDNSLKHFLILGLIAALGFLTNFSMVWLIPIWPLSYLLYKKNLFSIRRLLIFSLTFLLLTSWFIPTFLVQSTTFRDQVDLSFNLTNIFRLFANYFGILGIHGAQTQNVLLFPFIILLGILFFWQWKSRKNDHFRVLLISTFSMFFLFLLVVGLTGSRLFYARVSIALIVAFYILIADSFSKIEFSKEIVYTIIIFQLSQSFFYFFPNENFSRKYEFYYYHSNPISFFQNHPFRKDSCVLPIPGWNKLATQYYLKNKARVIFIEDFEEENKVRLKSCSKIYILNQVSVKTEFTDSQFAKINSMNYQLIPITSYYDQSLFLLNKRQNSSTISGYEQNNKKSGN